MSYYRIHALLIVAACALLIPGAAFLTMPRPWAAPAQAKRPLTREQQAAKLLASANHDLC